MDRSFDPVAKGLCRPPMMLMAPFDSVVINGMLSVIVCLLFGNMALLPACAVPFHVVAVLVCMVEPRAFELAQRYLVAFPRGRARRRWKGVSLAQAPISSDGLR